MNSESIQSLKLENAKLQKELVYSRTLLELANSIVIRWDKDGIIHFMNDFGLCFFGYSSEELIGQHLLTIVPKVEISSGRDMSQLTKDIANNPDLYTSVPSENITKDGRTVWVTWTNKGIFDEQGNVEEILAIGNDITPLKEAELKRFEYHEKLDAALESMDDAVFISDNQGNFVHFNKAFATFHRFKDKSECLSQLADYPKIQDVFLPNGELLPLDQWVVLRALRGETGTDSEYTLRRKNTGETWVGSFNFGPFFDLDGNIAGSVVVARDITERKQLDEKLRFSEKRSLAYLENSPACTKILDLDFNLQFMSEAGVKGLNIDNIEDYYGKPYPFYFYPESFKKEMKGNLELAKETREIITQEAAVVDIDGNELWFHSTIVPVSDNEGELDYFMVVSIDTTDRKRAEETLQKSIQNLRLAQRIANIGNWTLDPEVGVPEWSDEIYRILERKPESGPYSLAEYKNLFKGEWFQKFNSAIQRAIHEGQPYDHELKIEFAPDKVKWIHSICEPEQKPESNRYFLRGTIQDITERKMAAYENKRLTDRLLLATASAQLGIWDWNVRENIMIWDDRMFEMYGLTREGIPSNLEAWLIGLHPADKDSALAACQAALNGEKDFDTEFRVLHPDGTVKHLKANGLVLIGVDGKPDRMLGINADITEQKHAEEEKIRLENQLLQSQKIESIGQLAGGIAHDFNNLLSVIVGNLELLQFKQQAGDPFDENIARVMQASTRAKDLVAQILTFSRQEKLSLVAVDLSTIVDDSMKFLRPVIPTTVEVLLAVSAAPLPIYADTTQLQQVLINLCNNAVHAMNEKGLLQIDLNEEELTSEEFPRISESQSSRYAKLTITDTGTGMDKKTLSRIFDPFFTTKKVGVGTGMGLSVVHGIVKQHGGHIQVDSTPGQGSTFTLYFPIISADEVTDKPVVEDAPPTGTERILFVDDEPCVADSSSAILEEILGYKVTTMTDCVKALDLFKTHPYDFDLVITDQTMPKMSGVDLAKELLAIRPDLPIILCSGYSAQVSEKDAKVIGIRAFCMKPLLMDQLAQIIRNVLDKSDPSATTD